MSICKVEGFYDSIRRCRTKDVVLKRTQQEVEHLNKVCGSIGSLKRYYSKYRNFLKDTVDKERLVSGVSLLGLLLSTLRLSEHQQSSFTQSQRQEISKAQGNLRKIYDTDKYLIVATGLLGAVSVYDQILGLVALTGRRVAEIACTGSLPRVKVTSTLLSLVDNSKPKVALMLCLMKYRYYTITTLSIKLGAEYKKLSLNLKTTPNYLMQRLQAN